VSDGIYNIIYIYAQRDGNHQTDFDIILSLSTKIDKVVAVRYKCGPVGFSCESRRILGSDVTRTKNQLVYIFNQHITVHVY
jgi:hypothetical protein